MINWYYVQGSERVGPVNEEALKDLFQKEVLNLESYVWRKGFANWEKLQDVSELNFTKAPAVEPVKEEKKERKQDKKHEVSKKEEPKKEKESSPEIILNFDWNAVGDEEELFFIKIGRDRKQQLGSNLYGPYSLRELQDALEEKRINNRTLIFAAGMAGWVEVGQTPLDPKNLKINATKFLDETPLLMVVNNEPHPLITLVQQAGTKECILLGAGAFQAGKVVLCSMYSGTALKAKNLKLTIKEYRPLEQKVLCNVIEISESAKKIMQNYAD